MRDAVIGAYTECAAPHVRISSPLRAGIRSNLSSHVTGRKLHVRARRILNYALVLCASGEEDRVPHVRHATRCILRRHVRTHAQDLKR
jgi:hypothetical protein